MRFMRLVEQPSALPEQLPQQSALIHQTAILGDLVTAVPSLKLGYRFPESVNFTTLDHLCWCNTLIKRHRFVYPFDNRRGLHDFLQRGKQFKEFRNEDPKLLLGQRRIIALNLLQRIACRQTLQKSP
jgi:hypothetical protein